MRVRCKGVSQGGAFQRHARASLPLAVHGHWAGRTVPACQKALGLPVNNQRQKDRDPQRAVHACTAKPKAPRNASALTRHRKVRLQCAHSAFTVRLQGHLDRTSAHTKKEPGHWHASLPQSWHCSPSGQNCGMLECGLQQMPPWHGCQPLGVGLGVGAGVGLGVGEGLGP